MKRLLILAMSLLLVLPCLHARAEAASGDDMTVQMLDTRDRAVDRAPEHVRSMYGTLEAYQRQWKDLEESGQLIPGMLKDGIPGEQDLSSEESLCIAYAAMMEKYGYDLAVLELLYPDFRFNVEDEEDPVWFISLIAYDDAVYSEYGQFYIQIKARTGEIVRVSGPEDALG